MKYLKKALAVAAIAATATSANAALYKFEAAYGAANAVAAEAAFLSSTYNGVLEDFEGFTGPGQDNGTDQNSWVEAASSFSTNVGTFKMQTPDSNPSADDLNVDDLMIEDDDTGEFGRSTLGLGQWLDSNDADEVLWEILDGSFNAFGFYLSDANDQGAALKLVFEDGSTETLQLNSPLSNGNVSYITVFSDIFFTSATLVFDNGVGENDGWGIDQVRIARVPEPGTLALLGLGLAGIGIARRRKQS